MIDLNRGDLKTDASLQSNPHLHVGLIVIVAGIVIEGVWRYFMPCHDT